MTFPTLPMSIPRYPDCVLLCEYGDVARWKNGAVFTPDEARRAAEAQNPGYNAQAVRRLY